jgi:UDP-N-acetylmuramate--alanine ligase
VAEADESDRSFLKLLPIIALVTNIEEEHMDCYRDIDDIRDTFVEFLNKVPFYGFNAVCLDDKHVQQILPLLTRKVITYGTSLQARYRFIEPVFKGFGATFTPYRGDEALGEITLNVPGMHNCLNALGALATAMEIGVALPVIQEGLASFRGVQRRCHVRGEAQGIMVMDDYGHHPTEIKMTLRALKNGFPERRIVVVFQPHRYSRTRDLFGDFITAFYDAAVLFITGIYAASETPIPGVSAAHLADEVKGHGHRQVMYVEDKSALPETLKGVVQPDDIVVFLGAGDVWRQGIKLLEILSA